MPYSAKCQIKIKTDNYDEFERFVQSVRSEYGDLNVEKLPDDVDIEFSICFKTDVNFEDIDE